ncbi:MULTISPECIES: SHOCT domain-containing protein [unclassified Leucobacter]|uniref:SHOCT domain-containing protein n=1 Tax=unclassified Leucobacter TaxID=2621730 RepID=UPI00301AE39D
MGLLRTAARASVAARVVGNVQRRQQTQWAAQDAARAQSAPAQNVPAQSTAPPTAPAAAPDTQTLIDQLTQLGQLRDAGVLTPAEFDAQKQRLLTSS